MISKAPAARSRIGLMVRDPIRAEGLIALFSDSAELRTITPAQAAHDHQLSIVIVDADDGILTLLATFRRARPGLRLLVFGDSNDQRYIGRIVAAGAKGYLLHSASEQEICAAVEVIEDGSIWAPRKVLASLIDTYAPQQPRRPDVQFTERELQVLQLLVQGRSDREIAAQLGISPRTVQSAVGRLLKKVGVENRVALTVRVLEQHLVPL